MRHRTIQRKHSMQNLSPRHVKTEEALRLGVVSGWYSTKVSGTFVSGPHDTEVDCLRKSRRLILAGEEEMTILGARSRIRSISREARSMTLARGKIGGYEFNRMVVLFSMMDGATEIRCASQRFGDGRYRTCLADSAGPARTTVPAVAGSDRTTRPAEVPRPGVRGQSSRHHPAQHRFSQLIRLVALRRKLASLGCITAASRADSASLRDRPAPPPTTKKPREREQRIRHQSGIGGRIGQPRRSLIGRIADHQRHAFFRVRRCEEPATQQECRDHRSRQDADPAGHG